MSESVRLKVFQEEQKYKGKNTNLRKKIENKIELKKAFLKKYSFLLQFFKYAPPEKLSEWNVNFSWEIKKYKYIFFPLVGKEKMQMFPNLRE